MNIPALSRPFFSDAQIAGARPTGAAALAMFNHADRTENGKDPSNCAFLSLFPGGAVGWMAKLAIDADGKAAGVGYHSGRALDPDAGQDSTSLRYADGSYLSSEGTPYYVLPGGSFAAAIGLEIGDVGIVIYRSVLTAAILGDSGPSHKIGEASIRVHNRLYPAAPDPCEERDSARRCLRIRNSSIASGVIAVFFSGSHLTLSNAANSQAEIEAKAFSLWKIAGGNLPAPNSAPSIHAA